VLVAAKEHLVDSLGPLLPILVIVLAFWLLILRPARKRQRDAAAVRSRLEPGARVMTTAGLFGTLTAVEGDEVELEIAEGVRVRYVAAAIARVIPEPDAQGTTPGAAPSVGEADTPQA
jgi:preprotein translocase subunit YajC